MSLYKVFPTVSYGGSLICLEDDDFNGEDKAPFVDHGGFGIIYHKGKLYLLQKEITSGFSLLVGGLSYKFVEMASIELHQLRRLEKEFDERVKVSRARLPHSPLTGRWEEKFKHGYSSLFLLTPKELKSLRLLFKRVNSLLSECLE